MEADVSLYVHIPFCRSRCGYCAFASGLYDADDAAAYLDALERETVRWSETVFAAQRPLSVFIGGGTPSSLTMRQLERLLSFLPLPGKNGEATCELNPDSTDAEKLHLLHNKGITRCSFGVQTFSEKGLRLFERRHDAQTAIQAVTLARRAGFSDISIDLITGWPGQELEELAADLRQAISLGVDHISCYNLMVEPESAFQARLNAHTLIEKDEDEARLFWDMADATLRDAGFEHYETSNFARPGHRCRHNVHIWRGGEYVGLGAAAHSHLGGRRFANMEDRKCYIAAMQAGKTAESFSETLPLEDRARECAVFWLRLFEGIDLALFRQRTGQDFMTLYADIAPRLLRQGFLALAPDQKTIFVPPSYHPILDALLPELV